MDILFCLKMLRLLLRFGTVTFFGHFVLLRGVFDVDGVGL